MLFSDRVFFRIPNRGGRTVASILVEERRQKAGGGRKELKGIETGLIHLLDLESLFGGTVPAGGFQGPFSRSKLPEKAAVRLRRNWFASNEPTDVAAQSCQQFDHLLFRRKHWIQFINCP